MGGASDSSGSSDLTVALTSASSSTAGSTQAGPAPWNRANATSYSRSMLWEQIRTVLPIFAFLIFYQGLVLAKWPAVSELMGILGGVCCVVVGLAIFMEGLKNGMMPLGEEVGMVMGQKLSRNGVLILAFVLGILVTMAEPAIATLKQAGALVHPDPDCDPKECDARVQTNPVCRYYCDLQCNPDCSPAQDQCVSDDNQGCRKDWTPGAPFLYATVNLWSDWKLPVTIGTGVGMACTVGMLRSLLDLKMKRIIFILVPITLALTVYIRFVASVEVRDILGLAWDCGAVTTGPVTVPLVLALGVGVSADGSDDKDDKDEENEPGSRGAAGKDGDEDDNWASAFGVVTLASLFPVIVVLLFAVLADAVANVNGILESACEAARLGNPALAPVNDYVKHQHQCPNTAADGTDASSGSSSDDVQSLSTILLDDMQQGLQAVCPLVLFLVCVLKFLLHAEIPTVALPDPLNANPAAEKSNTVIHVSWGALCALIGMIIFYVGLQTGLIALGKSVGNILPIAFTHIDSTPGTSGEDPSGNSIGQQSKYCEVEDARQEKCKRGVALVALFSWFLGFGATCAEPALNTLGLTVERLTKGKFKRVMLIGAVSFGVATGITIGVLRLIYGLDLIVHILLPGYTIALILTAFSTEEYICVAWDSAGVTTGPITVPLVVSMGLGISDALKIKDGFGILACASVSPIISVLATGLWVNGFACNPCAKSPTPQVTPAAERLAAGAGVPAAAAGSAGFQASDIQQVSSGSAAGNPRVNLPQPAQQPAPQPQASEGDATSQLRLAAGAGDEAGVAAELAKGARVDAADAGGQTALYKAANLGKPAIVKLLVNGGADVNKINQKNFTPLMAAALCGHVEVVKLLLDYGADPTVKNKRGKTALDLASACNGDAFEEVCALLPPNQGGAGAARLSAGLSGVSRAVSPQRQAGVSRPASPQRQSTGQFVA